MRFRLLGMLAAILLTASPLSAGEPVQQTEISIATEVRLVNVPAGFCERHGIDREKGTGLNDAELKKVLEAVQAHREGSVLQLPKITCFDGQTATIRNGEQRMFLTAVEAVRNKGTTVLVPKNSPIDLGDTLTLCGRVSADRKFVNYEAKFTHTRLNGEVNLVPFTTLITPVFEGGSQGTPIPFTQYLQSPDVKTKKIEKTVVVPDGGTIVLGGWNETVAKQVPMISKIPYLSRFYKNVGPTETEVIVLTTARVIHSEAHEVAPMPRECLAKSSAVYKLRNVAAADAVQAISGYLTNNKMPAAVVADPISNSVLITAEKATQVRVRTLLNAMDATPRQVQIQALIVQVPWGFLSDIGMTDDADRANVLTLTPRELNLFNTQLRNAKNRDIISRPQIVVADNQNAIVHVGQTVQIRAGYEIVAGENGQTLAFKKNPVETGLKLQVRPRIDPKGETVLLRVETLWTKVGGIVAAPLTLPPEITGLPYPLTTDVPSLGSVTTQTMTTTTKVDFGRTIILRGLSCENPGDERGGFAGLVDRAFHGGGEVLIVLTPYAVKSAAGVGGYGR